jgi:hypothetical protein
MSGSDLFHFIHCADLNVALTWDLFSHPPPSSTLTSSTIEKSHNSRLSRRLSPHATMPDQKQQLEDNGPDISYVETRPVKPRDDKAKLDDFTNTIGKRGAAQRSTQKIQANVNDWLDGDEADDDNDFIQEPVTRAQQALAKRKVQQTQQRTATKKVLQSDLEEPAPKKKRRRKDLSYDEYYHRIDKTQAESDRWRARCLKKDEKLQEMETGRENE